jgi:hypothetical protein
MSSVNQETGWDAGATLGGGEAQGRVETLAPWTPSLWKPSPCHNKLREQVGHHPHTGHWLQTCLGGLQQTKQCFPAGATLGSKKQKIRNKTKTLKPPPVQRFSMPCYTEKTRGLLHWQMPAPNLLRRRRQTGLDAEGVTPELLRQKFYCFWTWNFSFLFFQCLSHLLSICPPSLLIDFFGSSFSFCFYFFSFFFGFVSFTIVN